MSLILEALVGVLVTLGTPLYRSANVDIATFQTFIYRSANVDIATFHLSMKPLDLEYMAFLSHSLW